MIDAIRFMYWLNTAELVLDLGKELGEETLMGCPGLLFEDRSYVEIVLEPIAKAEFRTICSREEIGDANLLTVCQFLWDNHSRDNYSKDNFPEGAR